MPVLADVRADVGADVRIHRLALTALNRRGGLGWGSLGAVAQLQPGQVAREVCVGVSGDRIRF